MLKFIDDNDFLLVDKYKQNDDGSVNWSLTDGDHFHTGVLFEGMTRDIEVEDGTESIKTGTKQVEVGTQDIKIGERPALDENGDQEFEDIIEAEPIYETQDVYEEQTKYKTETVDIWGKFQSLLSSSAITVDTSHLLVDLKLSAKEVISSQRDSINYGGIEHNGHTYQTDPQSITDIMGAVITGGDTVWLTADNQHVPMSNEQMRLLGVAIAERKKYLVYKAREFKDAIAVMDNETDISNYISNLDWSA